MKSPWKVIAGLVSRGKPETPDELEYEILATPDPSAEQPNIDVVRLKIGASHPPFSTLPVKEVSLELPTAPQSGLGRPTSLSERKPIAGVALSDEVDVLATTIRLVTKDRLSVRAVPSASTVPEANGPDVSVTANINGSGKAEPTALLKNDTSVANKAGGRGKSTRAERADGARSRQRAAIDARPARSAKRRSSPATSIDAAASLPEQGFIAETMRLNSEIEQLRQQLAQKLRRQNEQLRGMLKRFEVG
jgi:hypothetical protein